MLNKVQLIGNLGTDVKMHYFDNGDCVGNASLATSESWKNKQGEKQTATEWHSLIFRNKQAETAQKYLTKGKKIFVEGKIKKRKYQDTNGNERYTTEIHVFQFLFLDSLGTNEQQRAETTHEPVGDSDDDLPF